jgi:PAS domain S-box-containing protein
MLRRHRTIRVLLQDAPPWLYGCAAALSAFVLAVVSLYSVSEVSTRVLKATVDEQLLSMATLCASLIDADKHSTLQAPEQQNGETYEAVVSPLRAMVKATPQIKYVYTVRMAADGPRFGVDAAEAVDGDGDGVIDQAGLNEFYEDPDETLLAAFATKAARVCERPFTDKWGTFMSGFAPVRTADGRFECIVGVDMDANEYLARVEAMAQTARVGAFIAAFASAGFGFAVFALRRRRGTEQRMVHALAESESRFRTLIEGSDVVMWEYDVGADAFTYVSPQAAKLGYALDEWRRPGFWRELIHADDAESAAEMRRVCVERREPHRFQYRMLAADRSTVWIDDVSSAPEEVDGRLMLRGVLVDITDRIVAAERQEAALSLATRLSSAADTREAARIVNDSLTKMVGVHRSAVLLYDDDGCCRFVGWRNLSRDYRRAVEGHCPWKLGERGAEPIVVDDCGADPALAPYRDVLHAENIRSLAFVPITTGEGVVGKLMLYGAEAHAFSARQIASAAEAAVYLGVAAGRLQAQERLTASEARLRTIIDTALDAVVGADEDGTISAWNRQAEITFGWSAGEAIGRRLQDLAMPAVGGSLSALAGRRIEIPARTKAGAEITVEISIAPVRHGGTLAFSAFIRDISERIRIESERAAEAAELRHERERLDLTVRGAGLGTWEWDVERSVVTTNDRSSTMLGYSPGEIDTSVAAWIELVHPDDRAEVEASVTAALLGVSADYRCEHRFRRKDGTWAWVLDAGRITERAPDGRALRACGVHVDVSSAHELAERLAKARDAAEAATRAKSEFLANMSHEIRTPMTAILGYAELLNEDDGGPDTAARRRERVEVIRHNGEHLLALINDILDISKIEAGKLVIDRSDADPLAVSPRRGRADAAEGGRARNLAAARAAHADPAPHPHRPASPPADPRESHRQRHQVHGARPRDLAALVRPRGERRATPSVRRGRHRHRHGARRRGAALPRVRAGGRVDDPQVRRHRSRPLHLQAPRGAAERRHRRRERTREGQRVHARRGRGRGGGAHARVAGGDGRPGARAPRPRADLGAAARGASNRRRRGRPRQPSPHRALPHEGRRHGARRRERRAARARADRGRHARGGAGLAVAVRPRHHRHADAGARRLCRRVAPPREGPRPADHRAHRARHERRRGEVHRRRLRPLRDEADQPLASRRRLRRGVRRAVRRASPRAA